MSENSQLPVLVIKDWLDDATMQLQAAGISSARLDSEIILAHCLRKNRTYLHAHADDPLEARVQEVADARLLLRLDRVPIAYIIGHKEFYGRQFRVTTATLIPRPESEALIDALGQLIPQNQTLLPGMTWRVVDVGTGSGCLGITAKLEHPELDVTLLDNDSFALKVAAANAQQLQADVRIIKSDLLQSYPFQPNIIVANLPYVDRSWQRSPETDHEPAVALFADADGLALIYKLIDQAKTALSTGGTLLLEADPRQLESIAKYGTKKNFTVILQHDFCIALKRS